MKFGTSGLRGLVEDMTDAVCEAHVAAFLRHLGHRGGEAFVGRDLRPSSPRIATACMRAVAACGAVAVDCGVTPTPALALEALRRGAPAIMVTGSHIPFDRNGLKFYRPDGEITKADEAGVLAALAQQWDAPPGAVAGAPPSRHEAAVGARYVARCVDFFGADVLAGCRIGVWQHSAAGRDLLGQALADLGAEVTLLGRTNDFVPIDTEAVAAEDAARIRDWVLEHGLDALASTDGDGDRPLLADETGTVLRGDAMGALTARILGADGVAAPLNASTALERSGWFARVARTRIGSPFVIEGLAELRAQGARLPVGFEANGGFLLGGDVVDAVGRRLDALPTRDALVPIVALLAEAAQTGGLARLAATLPARATASDRLTDVPEAASDAFLAELIRNASARAALIAGLDAGDIASIDTRDGLRMALSSGDIAHLRPSGNAPELRIYTESRDPTRATALLSGLLAHAREALALVPNTPRAL